MPIVASEFFKFADDLREAPAKMRQETGDAIGRTAQKLASDAQANAPRGATGRLQESLKATQRSPTEWRVAASIRYAGYNEFGTARQAPNPFLGRAVDANEEAFFKAVEEALTKAFNL
jgi:HK97 gp10 family phage protein